MIDAVGEVALPAHRDGVDAVVVGVQMQGVEAVGNSNSTPRPPQRLVQRGEDDVAHAGGHLPEDRAPVLEEHHAD